jgi:3-oxoacyl-[acyl-carrier-protein] synthase I
MSRSVQVLASGMVSALGYNAPATLAAMRAGISGVRKGPWDDFVTGTPLSCAKVPLPQWWDGVGKLADLVAPAIHECLASLPAAQARDVPLFIGVASAQRPHRWATLEATLLDEVHARLQRPAHPDSRLFAADQIGGAQALKLAGEGLMQGRYRHAVVAGVDSFLSLPMLQAYGAQRRLITGDNSNGFMPGEAGAAVLLGVDPSDRADTLHIRGLGWGHEPSPVGSLEPLRADGLTQAVRDALAQAGVRLNQVACRLTDLTGEHHLFKEAAFVAGRLNGGPRAQPLDLWHPAEYIGHVGAAILPCLLAQALHACQHGYAPGPWLICQVGDDAGQRAAIVVQGSLRSSDE